MTTALQSTHSTASLAERLAIDGGTKTVTTAFRDRWKPSWWRDAWQIAKQMRWGFTTLATRDGPVREFEDAFAALTGCKHALAMNSGTAALHSALFAVGVGPGDEVIVPSYTWHATVSAILCCGGKPVFCDINPTTLTADPADVERRITPRTKAIMVVHVWGNPGALDALRDVADRKGVALVEDCSHAHGATYRGKSVGAWGDIGCFSLQGGKAVSAGEGGVAVCNKREYYARMLALGHPVRAGVELREEFGLCVIHLGPKYRPHLFGAVLALSGVRKLDRLNSLRRHNWQLLCDELAGCDEVTPVAMLPGAQRGGFLEFKLILSRDRLRVDGSKFVEAAKAEGVPLSGDRYGALHRILAFRKGGPITLDMLTAAPEQLPPVVELPNTDALAGRVVTLPAFTDVPEAFIRQCAAALRKVARHFAN
jgi:perosamine synthetase